MAQSDYNSAQNTLSREEIRQLQVLCASLEDGVITSHEQAELNALLHRSQAARKLYLRHVGLRRMLEAAAGRQQRCETEKLRRHVQSAMSDCDVQQEEAGQPASGVVSRLLPGDPRSYRILAIAASLLVLAAVGTYWRVAGTRDPIATDQEQMLADNSNVDAALASKALVPVAKLSYVSSSTVWKQGSNPQDKEALTNGSVVELLAGQVELVYSSGTRLLLLAPARFSVGVEGGTLLRGGLVASVTEAGHGFTVELPHGKVVDLGTEFGVAVDDFGVAEVNVFHGKVEAFPKRGQANQKIELTAGNGLQWSENDLVPLHADLNRFASTVAGRNLDYGPSEASRSIIDRFRDKELDADTWQSLGDVRPTPEGLQITGGGSDEEPPYLISVAELDPALGPVTLACDLRFLEVDPQGSTSISVLTRSAGERGIALPPWQGVLASCTRCSFSLESPGNVGSLHAGVKLESDRELSSISWSGFSTPQPGTPYRMIVRDDGVNLSFTVFRRDEPSERKNVNVRSLFRGQANHLALEGPHLGQLLVERVEITQDVSSPPLSNYSDFSSLVFNDRKQRERRMKLLAALSPDGPPVLQDDFERGEIDPARWSIVGDVNVVNGRVQLGLPNAEGHIDTWKHRPYLLSRQQLDPRDGRLTIVGAVSFAENFLSGYGGSFAVMTRADDQLGEGPGWEYSILRRGVRANFWPAAWDTQHTLEIHEKPTPNTITLLTTQGLEVDPEVRTYLFRVVDDGEQVTLTIVDPQRPEDLKTVSTTGTTLTQQGFVGFESCWGSPVMLDDIRIFQTSEPNHEAEQSSKHE